MLQEYEKHLKAQGLCVVLIIILYTTVVFVAKKEEKQGEIFLKTFSVESVASIVQQKYF